MATKTTHFSWRPRHRVVLVGEDNELHEFAEYLESAEQRTEILQKCVASEAISVLQRTQHLDVVYVSMTGLSENDMLTISHYCEKHELQLCFIPMCLCTLHRKHRLSVMGSTLVLTARREPLDFVLCRSVKRMMDVVVSLLFLFFIFPLIYIVMAVLIKKKSPGHVFNVEEYFGVDGRKFRVLKFRTADVMRPTFIDSLPLFISVLAGNLSLVGPALMDEEEASEYKRLYIQHVNRRLLRPGLTGWAQQMCQSDDTMQRKVNGDIWYAENWTPWLDLKLMMKEIF